MPGTLIKNATKCVTMNRQREEIDGCSILVEDGVIKSLGTEIDADAEVTIDATGCIVTPGLVNTHHHLFQTMTRCVPACQDALLFGWLKVLYPVWSRMRPDDIFVSTQIGLAELALSGCTLSSDHLYLFPNGSRLDDSIAGAETVGIRFHPTRGSMSIGESDGGLPPDALVEKEPEILDDCIRLVDRFHDPSPGSKLKVGIAPCSPFSVSRELMRDSALLARDKHVSLHTHLAENDEDVSYSLENFGCRPGQYAEELGWTGDDVWHAHCVKLNDAEIDLFAKSRTGVAHCPCSNCRLGSGIAPIRAMIDAGVPVGLGVDGSASNDSGHLLQEARQAVLLQRVKNGADAMSARAALEAATLGGATVLGWEDCGSLQPGKRADIAIWDIFGLEAAGAWDPVAALVLCGPFQVRDLLVDGKPVVRSGEFVGFELETALERQRRMVDRLMLD